ncbi:MAG: hypothetical protein ACN6NI_04085 [Acinetobacter sp.]
MDYWNSVLLISIMTVVGLTIIIFVVGCKMWKNLVVTLLIATLIGFLIMGAINFIFGDRIHFLWGSHETGNTKFMLEMVMMSVLIGGVSTFIIMLGTLIGKSNTNNQSDEY